MRERHMMKKLLLCALMVCGLVFCGTKAYAAETQFTPGATMEKGSQLGMNNDGYYATTNGVAYASFVTPAEGGYLEIEYKNISIDAHAYANILSISGDTVGSAGNWKGDSEVIKFRSEPNGRNGAKLQPNTKYYIQIGKEGYTGNVKLVLTFTKDVNPDGKAQAETIVFNKEYTRTIDGNIGYNDPDHDYFKITAATTGACHFKIVNATDATLRYAIRKWGSDEFVKKTNNYDMDDRMYGNGTEEYDITLEAGQTYYLDVYGDTKGNYTIMFNNQSVKSITMPSASITLAPGKEYTLNPTVAPATAYNKTLKYTSNNTDVATVNEKTGEVYARGAGKTVITATATDGSNTTATCIVYVTPGKPSTPSYSKVSTSYITLTWYATTGANGYTIYRKSGKTWKKVADTTKTTYKIKKLKAGTKYQFKIKAYVNADGKKYSPDSDIAYLATAPKKTSITKIIRQKKTSNGYQTVYKAKIKWKKAKGATSYKIYYKKSGYSSKSYFGEYKGTSANVYLRYGKYSRDTKTYTFYVVPVKKYDGKTFEGPMSKGKKYKFR